MAMKRAIVLIRVSTEQQAGQDRNGLAAQRAACDRLVRQHGLTVAHTVELVDVSGAAIMATPEMQELLRLLYMGQYHALVVREFSRALRPQNYDYLLFQALAETRVTLYSETAVIEPWTPTGRMMVAMHGVIAANELDTIRTRMMGGKEALRRAGKWAAGRHCLPVGVAYDRQTGQFSYTDRAVAVRRVFKQFLSGRNTNYDALARELGMARNTARNVLSNPLYCGWLVYDRKRDDRRQYNGSNGAGRHRDRPKVARAPEEVIRVRVIDEPLITEAEFARVQQMIAAKASSNLRSRTKLGHFVYNGYLWCQRCGARLHTCRNQFNRHYYVCSNKKRCDDHGNKLCQYSTYLNRDKLEALLDDVIVNTLASPAALRRLLKSITAAASGNGKQAARAAVLVQQLQQKRVRIVDAYVDGTIGKHERDKRLLALDGQLRSAEQEQASLSPAVASSRLDADKLAELFTPLAAWRTLQRGEKRTLLATLQPAFVVRDYKVMHLRLDSNTGSRLKMARSRSPARPCR
jgi:DNA invertase Pin-like site-specific DNA recombinase